MTDQIRFATAADLDAVTALASAKRRQCSSYQPVYWASAPDAEKVQRPYLAKLIDNEDVITLVSESSGTITGHLDLEKREALRACGLGGARRAPAAQLSDSSCVSAFGASQERSVSHGRE